MLTTVQLPQSVQRLWRRLFGGAMRVFMTDDEVAALELALSAGGRPRRVLEWGSGGSTVRFAGVLPEGSSWLAIEHQSDWAGNVASELARRRLDSARVVYVPPNGVHAEGEGDGSEETFRDYIARPRAEGVEFDAVLVDGRARNACLREGFAMLAPGGFAMLHDAQRPMYSPGRPPGSFRVRFVDPRQQMDGRDLEMHFFFAAAAPAETLAAQLRNQFPAPVRVELDPAT